MTVAQGIQSQLTSKAQSAFGTAATGNYTKKKFVTHNLELKRASQVSATLRSDREIQDFRLFQKSMEGDVNVEFGYQDYEDWIASAMFASGAMTSGVAMGIGTTPNYVTLEDGALDISRYKLYRDCLVSKMLIRVQVGRIIETTFSFVGTQMSTSGSTGSGTAVAAGTNTPFDSASGAIYDDAAESGSALAAITSFDLTIDNGAKAAFAVFNNNAALIEYGPGNVSGNISIYYEHDVWLNRFLNETEFALSFHFTDTSSHGYLFKMPRCKLAAGATPVANPQSRVLTAPFHALKPTSGGVTTALQITGF